MYNKDDGDCPVLVGPSPVSATDFDLVAREDAETYGELELDKKKEAIAYIVLD
jgi:hypothetical protein